MSVRVVGVSGSFRRGSYNAALLAEAARRAPDGFEVEILRIEELPFYCQDIDVDGSRPVVVEAMKERVRDADALLIATPEYDYGVPGVVHNAVEWLSRPTQDNALDRKPVAFMGASTGYMGTIRCQLQLRQSWYYFKAPVFSRVELTVSNAKDSFDADLHLKNPFLIDQLDRYLTELRDWLEWLER